MTDPETDRPVNDMRELYAVQHAVTDAGGTLTPGVHKALDALREVWDRGLRREQQRNAAPAVVPVSAAAPPTDRASLRDHIAAAIGRIDLVLPLVDRRAAADEVLAVLPPTADRAAAERACEIRLREATSGAVAHMQDVEPNPELTTDSYADGWNECLADVRAAVAGELPLPYRQIVERAFAERLAVQLANCCEECDGCIVIARRLAAETAGPEAQGAPRRGDAVDQWLKTQRDISTTHSAWRELDDLLDRYRLHADTGTPLGEHVCEGRVVGDCECLEQTAAAPAAVQTEEA